jgi:hypothetical protein
LEVVCWLKKEMLGERVRGEEVGEEQETARQK